MFFFNFQTKTNANLTTTLVTPFSTAIVPTWRSFYPAMMVTTVCARLDTEKSAKAAFLKVSGRV